MRVICGVYNYSDKGRDFLKEKIASMLAVFNARDGVSTFYLLEENKIALGVFSEKNINSAIAVDSNRNKNLASIWNGRIYNYIPLRESLENKGHVFKGDSYEEIIDYLYRDNGLNCFSLLEGDFCGILWDFEKNKLILVRDKLGVKPLYYAVVENSIIFASEIKVILSYPQFGIDVSEEALRYYFSFSYSCAPLTMFKGIYKVKPGHLLEFDASGKRSELQYWDAVKNINTKAKISGKECIDKIRYLLEEAVKKRLSSNEPIGCFLSGGRDSTAILALMSKIIGSQKINTFTIAFKPKGTSREVLNDDLNSAREISRIFKTIHREIIITPEDITGGLADIVWQLDDLSSLSSFFYAFFISKFAKASGVRIVLSGDGEEEVFFGYQDMLRFYRKAMSLPVSFLKILPKNILSNLHALFSSLTRGNFLEGQYLISHLLESMRRLSLGQELYWGNAMPFSKMEREGLFSEEFISRNKDFEPSDVVKNLLYGLYSIKQNPSLFEKMVYIDIKGWLAERYLSTLGMMSALNGIEIRSPFLDSSLVEFVMGIPENIRFKNKTSYLFNKSIEGLVPDWVLQRKKIFFPQPMNEWLTSGFIPIAKKAIFSSAVLGRGYINKQYVERMFHSNANYRQNQMYKIFVLYSLCVWFDKWIKK